MPGWLSAQRAFSAVEGNRSQGGFSTEQVIDAASFGAFQKLEGEGTETSHHFAESHLKGLVRDEVARILSEKGMPMGSLEVVQAAAERNVDQMYKERYYSESRYNPRNAPPMPGASRNSGDSFGPQSSGGSPQSWGSGMSPPRQYSEGADGYRPVGMTASPPRQPSYGGNYQSSGSPPNNRSSSGSYGGWN